MTEAPGTWMLLRGLTREARHWGAFVPMLAARLPGARIVTVDLPGFGQHHRLASPTHVQAMAEACRAELAARGVAGPVRLLGLSLGAMVAVAWAESHPQEVAGALLVNTSLRPFNPLHHRLRPSTWPTLLRLLLAPPRNAAFDATVLRLTTREPHADVLADWLRWRTECPVTRANALRQLWAAARFCAPAAAPPVALQLLASRGDGLVDPRCSQRLAQQWGCPIAWHPTAGHDLPLDDPAWVADQAAAFAARATFSAR